MIRSMNRIPLKFTIPKTINAIKCKMKITVSNLSNIMLWFIFGFCEFTKIFSENYVVFENILRKRMKN